jgi:hypothetical protein
MNAEQREVARAEFRSMMDFCLVETMNSDGSFKMMDEDTLSSSFLFPVSLLDELGYFRPSLRFWTYDSFPNAMHVAERIENRIKAMGLSDTESLKVLRRLEDARRERRAWWLGGLLLVLLVILVGWKLGKTIRRRRKANASLQATA